MFKIESDKPIPNPNWKKNVKYPFEEMNIGDSFIIPDDIKEQRSAIHASYSYGYRHGKKFKSGKDSEGNKRIWRVK